MSQEVKIILVELQKELNKVRIQNLINKNILNKVKNFTHEHFRILLNEFPSYFASHGQDNVKYAQSTETKVNYNASKNDKLDVDHNTTDKDLR